LFTWSGLIPLESSLHGIFQRGEIPVESTLRSPVAFGEEIVQDSAATEALDEPLLEDVFFKGMEIRIDDRRAHVLRLRLRAEGTLDRVAGDAKELSDLT
jgi:hypothetical protein